MRAVLLLWLGVALALSPEAEAHPLSSMRLDDSSWYGLAELQETLESLEMPFEDHDELVLAASDSWKGPLVVFTGARVDDLEALHAWVHGGGQLLVADDLGDLARVFDLFGVRLEASRPDHETTWRDHPALLVVERDGLHPLTRGVARVVTNHPARLEGRGRAVLAFQDGTGLLYELQLGQGRILLLSDPSMLTNQMLAFEGNLRLAINMLWHLCRSLEDECAPRRVGQGGRVSFTPEPLRADAAPTLPARVRHAWARWTAPLPLTAPLVRGLTWLLAIGVLLAALLLLPRSRAQGPKAWRWSFRAEKPRLGEGKATEDARTLHATSWHAPLLLLQRTALETIAAAVRPADTSSGTTSSQSVGAILDDLARDPRMRNAAISARELRWLRATWSALEVEELSVSRRRWTRADFRRTLSLYRRVLSALDVPEEDRMPRRESDDNA